MSAPVRVDEAVIWHDAECGSYRADIPLWRRLAAYAAPPGRPCEMLDLGCGTGRVSLEIAADGHRVTGLDLDFGAIQLSKRA